MKVYNTLTRKKEDFKTIEKNKVKMYVCGPTVYDYIHIGNARPLVVFDTFRRYLEYKGNQVDFVMNFTDIDDKIINRAQKENVDFKEISEKYIGAFRENARGLNVDDKAIHHPKATEHIEDMISFIADLEDKSAAYDSSDSVYFNISKAKNYGKLSRKSIEDLEVGSRVDVNDNKKDPMDFALWKKQKSPDEPAWDSPWGKGRPGWHIECSVMAKCTLGETIDIHGGGEDLQFPHHENEIAQSETLHDKSFANYWMHNAMITVNREKMAKSKGNFFTLHDIEKKFDLMIVRMWLISAHYRSQIDFSVEAMEQMQRAYDRLNNVRKLMERLIENSSVDEMSEEDEKLLEEIRSFRPKFEEAMDDDLNTAKALAYIFDMSRLLNSSISEKTSKRVLEESLKEFLLLSDILGIAYKDDEIVDEEIERLIEERTQARKDKNWQRADEIRDLLKEKGIELKDTSTGVVWNRVK